MGELIVGLFFQPRVSAISGAIFKKFAVSWDTREVRTGGGEHPQIYKGISRWGKLIVGLFFQPRVSAIRWISGAIFEKFAVSWDTREAQIGGGEHPQIYIAVTKVAPTF